jgi:hypothetical protein
MGDWSFAEGVKANPELYSRYEVLERLEEGTYGEVFKEKRKLLGGENQAGLALENHSI